MSKMASSSVCRRLRRIVTADAEKAASKLRKFQRIAAQFKKFSEKDSFRRRSDIYAFTVQRLSRSKSLIEEILEHQKKYEDITNEIFTSRLIGLYGKAGMLVHAQKLFDEMPQLNCPRTVYSFNVLLSAYVQTGTFDNVEELFKVFPEKLGITPDVITYNNVIKAYCEMGKFDSASLLFDEMENKGVEPSLITFNTLLNAFYMNKRFADGEKLWGLMESKNVVPDVRSYNSRLRGLAFERRLVEAVELFDEMKNKGITPNVISYNAMISGFIEDDNLKEVRNWYCKLKEDAMPDRVTYRTLIRFLCEKGDLGLALDLCIESINRNVIVGPSIVQSMVDELLKQSKDNEAKHLVNLVKSNKHFRSFHFALIK
uniref:Pentatricopeptide repeat-containing protein n=1 Tax=Rhizophora mucronata TaxID=61149 RepID=A0A2P2NGR6_RHIMU